MKREKVRSDFVAEPNEERSKKRVVFCSNRCFLESEKFRCEKNSVSERIFFIHVRHFKAVFVSILVLLGLVMIFLNFRLVLVVV